VSGKRRTRKILAIDWDLRTLRIVHAVVAKRRVSVERVLSVAVPPGTDVQDPVQMGRHIRRVLDEERIATRHAMVDIPRDQVTLNTLRLPAAAPDELPGMVEIQIAKELPFSVADAVVDFVAGDAEEGASTVAVHVAAVRREVLRQYEATFVAAGLRLERVGLRPFANKIAICELLRHAMPDRVMFIDVGPRLTEIDVLARSALVFSRAASVHIPEGAGEGRRLRLLGADGEREDAEVPAVSLSGDRDRPAQEVVDMLVLEVTRSVEAYRTAEPGATIDHVVIGGDLGVEERLGETIQKRLGISTEIYNPSSTFGWEPDEGAGAAAFATTLGLILGQLDDTGHHFDFLHPKKGESVSQRRMRKAPVAAAAAVVCVAAAGVVVWQITKSERERLAQLKSEISEIKERAANNEKFLRLVEEVRGFDAGHVVWVDVLLDALSSLPSHEEIVLTNLDMNRKDARLVLKTNTKSRDTATKVVEALNEFKRSGAEKSRFRASLGPQTEKSKDRYPFAQALRIEILDDGMDNGGAWRRAG